MTEGGDDDASMDVSASSAASPEGPVSKKTKPRYCVVCQKRTSRADLTYHRFPKKRKDQWMAACGLTEYKEGHVVCSLHFRAGDWAKKGQLKADAVPSVELGAALDAGPAAEGTGYGRYCVACRKKSNNPSHRFPKEGRERWLEACRLGEYKDSHRVCSLHFAAEDVGRDGQLKPGVIPTLNLGGGGGQTAGESTAQGRYCVVCRKRSKYPSHRFPREGRQRWLEACGLEQYKDGQRVCALHFASEDIGQDGRLKDGVIPSRNMKGGEAEGDLPDELWDQPGSGVEGDQQSGVGEQPVGATGAAEDEYCVVCRKRSTGPGLKHHRFPKKMRHQWMEACRLSHFKVRYRVCSLHFGPDDYDGHGKFKPNVVPSRNMRGMMYVVPVEILDEIAGGGVQQPGEAEVSGDEGGGEEEANAREENDLEEIAADIDEACDAAAVTGRTREELTGLKQKIARLRVKP